MTKYIYLVGSSIVKQWSNISDVSNKKIFNFGVSGFLTKSMLYKKYLKNLNIVNKSIIYPEYLIYYCGNNDLLHNINPNIVIKHIKTFLLYTQEMFEYKTKIVYLSLLRSPKKILQGYDELIDYINYHILLFCKLHNIIFVELNFLLNDRSDFVKDGVHLSNIGYNKVNNLLKIKKIF